MRICGGIEAHTRSVFGRLPHPRSPTQLLPSSTLARINLSFKRGKARGLSIIFGISAYLARTLMTRERRECVLFFQVEISTMTMNRTRSRERERER